MAYLTFEYKSVALMRGVTIRAYLPDTAVAGIDTKPLKALYFLPGFSADSTEIATFLRLRRQVELKNIAVFIVDGNNQFYIDHPERYQNYSTFVGKEVVEVTRRMFPLSDKREDTYIGGISMGGYGALYNGLRFKNTFSKIIALSPAVDICRAMEEHPDAGFLPQQLENLFGTREVYEQSEWSLNTYYSRENTENAPQIFLCCGEQDRLVHPQGREFAEAIRTRGYSCEFLGGKGDHDTDYWERVLDPAFSFLAGIPAGSRDDILMLFP
ncbi:MAG: prolyl oligopeptidase family serine peptidase [Lachnospiraceae bacterium]|nr:prolyl oligopeptidase family serine peptidase [Lachnospiraceae bacterium]